MQGTGTLREWLIPPNFWLFFHPTMPGTCALVMQRVRKCAQLYSRETTKEEDLATTSVSYNLPAFTSTQVCTVLLHSCLAWFILSALVSIKISSKADKLKKKKKEMSLLYKKMVRDIFFCIFFIQIRKEQHHRVSVCIKPDTHQSLPSSSSDYIKKWYFHLSSYHKYDLNFMYGRTNPEELQQAHKHVKPGWDQILSPCMQAGV